MIVNYGKLRFWVLPDGHLGAEGAGYAPGGPESVSGPKHKLAWYPPTRAKHPVGSVGPNREAREWAVAMLRVRSKIEQCELNPCPFPVTFDHRPRFKRSRPAGDGICRFLLGNFRGHSFQTANGATSSLSGVTRDRDTSVTRLQKATDSPPFVIGCYVNVVDYKRTTTNRHHADQRVLAFPTLLPLSTAIPLASHVVPQQQHLHLHSG